MNLTKPGNAKPDDRSNYQSGEGNSGAVVKPYLDWTSSLPLNLFITEDMPALTPVMTAKLRACTKGPPARAYNFKENQKN